MTELLHRELSFVSIGAAMEVHRVLGPGFLEVLYRRALLYELILRGIKVEEEKLLPVSYKGRLVGEYRADLVIENQVILELKAVAALNNTHQAQAINYLTATGLRLALILNFGAQSLQHRRIVK
jgi:GxxExxY protein